ncbi:uncharacterized protein L969DRAFT_46975 [Mixia osmundae IAM 14324]|uniref:DUF6534 domain-containing protein n=1 Tax=Mixia osmundae (strain CBS 9802 / IAM 14324 / JCM 22182 / KY 12970) TaxID=764103 RepID=G7E599_MIXOS|nr:uncharacterized protein L969DRAFT_46975 [Mixia osmundae IAM 14324]KEI40842.1 hypothetical protein L969DRAFT_46975 [Mixia osmundae IAM 14324]GAA98009.1 hypothetical protein E5Q_04689 [Mixia osmundae IAM 14324]
MADNSTLSDAGDNSTSINMPGTGTAPLYDASVWLPAGGPWLIGWNISFFLTGIISVQMYDYFKNHPKDRRLHRYSVAACAVLMAVLLGMDWTSLLRRFILQVPEGNFDLLASSLTGTVGRIAIMFQSMANALVQALFAERAHSLIFSVTRKRIFAWLLTITIAVSFAFGVAVSILNLAVSDEAWGPQDTLLNIIFTDIWLWGGVLANLLITGTLSWTLYESTRSAGNFRQTEGLVTTIMKMAWSTCALTSLSAFAGALALSVVPASSYNNTFAFFMLITPRFYVISYLFHLNSRERLRQRLAAVRTFDAPSRMGHFAANQAFAPSRIAGIRRGSDESAIFVIKEEKESADAGTPRLETGECTFSETRSIGAPELRRPIVTHKNDHQVILIQTQTKVFTEEA